jgi:hypothetical protein
MRKVRKERLQKGKVHVMQGGVGENVRHVAEVAGAGAIRSAGMRLCVVIVPM